MKLIKITSIATLCTLPILAQAHPGHAQASNIFAEGLLHPLTGLDHALALFAVGLLAARNQVVCWQLPLSFLGAILIGVLASQSDWRFASVEGLIAASVAVLGLLLLAPRQPMPIVQTGAALLLSLFGVAHGYAHGAETSHTDSALWLAGLLIASAMLMAVGVAVAMRCNNRRPIVVALGSFMTCFGLAAIL